jgi:hypothetical protein
MGRYLLAMLSLGALAIGVVTPAQGGPNSKAIGVLMTKDGKFARDYYACLLNGYMQGLSIQQINRECEIKMTNAEPPVDTTPFGDVFGGGKMFDPATAVTANCSPGDARISAGAASIKGWGEYSWGKERGYEAYQKGLDRETSKARKEEAIREAKEAEAEFDKKEKEAEQKKEAAKKAEQSGDIAAANKAKVEAEKAEKAAQEAAKKALEAAENAQKDPNEADGYTRTAQENSCSDALQFAREFLFECNRNEWSSYECERIRAKMFKCPDPAQIYVDPEQGYQCAPEMDKEALKNAWVAKCEELKRPGPDGNNPCAPPQVGDDARYIIADKMDGLCNDPYAYIDPYSEECAGTLVIQRPFGEPNLQELLVWGLNKLGGPVVVLPPRGDDSVPKGPGPDPRPGPKD